jgi:hypothetical protein
LTKKKKKKKGTKAGQTEQPNMSEESAHVLNISEESAEHFGRVTVYCLMSGGVPQSQKRIDGKRMG